MTQFRLDRFDGAPAHVNGLHPTVREQRASDAKGSPHPSVQVRRYFFDVHYDEIVVDESGSVLPDDNAAKAEGARTLMEMARDELPHNGLERTMYIVVRDDLRGHWWTSASTSRFVEILSRGVVDRSDEGRRYSAFATCRAATAIGRSSTGLARRWRLLFGHLSGRPAVDDESLPPPDIDGALGRHTSPP